MLSSKGGGRCSKRLTGKRFGGERKGEGEVFLPVFWSTASSSSQPESTLSSKERFFSALSKPSTFMQEAGAEACAMAVGPEPLPPALGSERSPSSGDWLNLAWNCQSTEFRRRVLCDYPQTHHELIFCRHWACLVAGLAIVGLGIVLP